MRRSSQQFIFQNVYNMASMIEECIRNEHSVIEMDWQNPELWQAVTSFSKTTLLHYYIYAMIAVEHRYEYRKNADLYEESSQSIRGIEEQLQAYDVPFLPYSQYVSSTAVEEATSREELPFYQWFRSQEEAFEELWEKLTDETFHLLFANRAFLLQFNKATAKYLAEEGAAILENYLDDNGYLRRAYMPVWVRDAVYFRDHGRCVLCQVDLSGLLSTDRLDHFDHMVPLAAHGVNDPCNIQLLCERCNLQKGERTVITGSRYCSWWS